ncbi:MAG TPA: branched-chain amino acid ABC transporter permease [Hyphomicrobiales bacterium]|nr:branched-chain amino acid ABC transporter permease [Hyphomicrobiales bacterium]
MPAIRTTPADTAPGPQAFLAAQTRWRLVEILFWLALLSPFFLLPTYLTLASQIAITALFALSVDLILGYAGIITLGHALFFGIGAYTAGLVAKWGWGEAISGLVLAALAAGFVGYVTGFIITRVHHLALIMITLGLGLVAVEAANSASWLTGGADGLQGVRMWKLLGTFEFDLWGYSAYGYSLGALFVFFLISRRIVHSPFGLSLRGIRENLDRMPAIGAPSRARLHKIYVISAAMAGVAGALLAPRPIPRSANRGGPNQRQRRPRLDGLAGCGSGLAGGGAVRGPDAHDVAHREHVDQFAVTVDRQVSDAAL